VEILDGPGVPARQALSRLSRVDGVPFPLIVALDCLAAAVTVNSVGWLPPKIKHMLLLPSREELHDLNDALQMKVLQIHTSCIGGAGAERQAARRGRAAPAPGPARVAGGEKHKALDRITAIITRRGRPVEASIISGLASLGAAGAVIIALFYYMKHRDGARQAQDRGGSEVLDRIDKIVDRHFASEEAQPPADPRTIRGEPALRPGHRPLMELSNSCQGTDRLEQGHEKAILELRAELRSLVGPPPTRPSATRSRALSGPADRGPMLDRA
jgi:hypothetical protein